MNKIYHLDSKQFEDIKEMPSLAWKLFPSTGIDLWEIPQLKVDRNNLWEVEFIPCYTSQYFCILVRINQTDMKARDRAYQHGGGFVFQLAQPRANNELTDVFTVFGTSPLEEREELQWSRFFVYYKDIDLVFKKAEDGEIVVQIDEEYTYMLAMAPWHYADPIGPFLTKRIGFNLIVPQPIEADHPVQYYSLIPGWKIMSEEELRDYVVYVLEEPHPPLTDFEVECSLESKHYSKGNPCFVRLGVNSSSTEEIEVAVKVDGMAVANEKFGLSKGQNELSIRIDTTPFDRGRRQLEATLTTSSSNSSHDLEMLIIDNARISAMRKRVSKLSEDHIDDMKMSESLVTIEWLLEALDKELASLKPHQSPWNIEELIERLEKDLGSVESGESLFISGQQLRLGLRSRQDATLQPYSLYIPSSYVEGESGLMVMLHGSATTDERTLTRAGPLEKFDRTKMILVAPLARGVSHYYLPEESIQEIIEITEKMQEMFSIPQEKIVLSGFSMGGFGVLNTFFHRPDLYRNLMLICGSMKAYEEMEVVRDFTTEESLQELAKTSLIIFHGAEDLNVRYEELKPVHERLLEMNQEIEIHIAEGVGHQQPPEWEEKMMQFLERIDRSGY